jgi:CRP-like cAMP-binding protein
MVGLRRHRIQRRLGSLLFLSYRERLVQLLLDLADQFGCRRDEEDGIRLRIKLSHRELAHLIGSTRETVAVLLGQLKAEGSVDGGRRSVVLTNPQRLVRV